MVTSEEANAVATTILQQLGGGGRLKAMIGANNMFSTCDGYVALQFKFKGSRKWNFVKIVLNAMDTYDITFYNLGKYDIKAEQTFEGYYADMMKDLFEEQTGLALSL